MINVSGSLAVQGNKAASGKDVYLCRDRKLTVSGALTDGAHVNVQLEQDIGYLALNYASGNPDDDPARFFTSEDGFEVALLRGNVVLQEEAESVDDSGSFFSVSDRVVSYENVNSRNWMSGISGERRLNEINLPGTHDAAMNVPSSAESLFEDPGSIAGGAKDARTQVRYIYEQLNDGFRWVDLRLNNKYQQRHNSFREFFDIDYKDDGKNLWLCHGCNAKGGTYYALDQNGNITSFNQVLDWAKEFLRKHPSEVLILSVRPETQWEDQWDTIYLRAKKILKQFSMEVNPSTGKPYLYMEDGAFGKDYTYYPKLKDVRGQVFLRVNHDRDVNGMATYSMGGVTHYAPAGGFEEPPPI